MLLLYCNSSNTPGIYSPNSVETCHCKYDVCPLISGHENREVFANLRKKRCFIYDSELDTRC